MRYVPSKSNFVWVFIMNACLILSDAFSAYIEMIMSFCLFFVDVVYHIDLCMLNHSYDARINPTFCGVWFFYIVGFSLVIFCWEFFSFLATPTACGSSQDRTGIESELELWYMPQLQQHWILNPLSQLLINVVLEVLTTAII